ncbi:MAG: hypothetical protein HKN76_16785 [Saprospiraceae bacterium]|nr:hypothetical protein [Saprospiraceae bacterium]
MKSSKILLILLTVTFFMSGCVKEDDIRSRDRDRGPRSGGIESSTPDFVSADDIDAQMSSFLDATNTQLASEGKDYRAVMVEYQTIAQGSEEAGRTVFFSNVGNKQLGFDFVPFDARRGGWSGPVTGSDDDIIYSVDQVDATSNNGVPGAQTTAAIDQAMSTWDAANCSDLPIAKGSDFGLDLGVVADIFGLGGSPFITADLMHAGWGDINFVGNVIAATFTFGFTDINGNFTDIDNNGQLDCAFREIYYDPNWAWAINPNNNDIDIETVALHEAGHGLSQGHFGKLHRTDSNGKFHFSPRAVMNAGYTGVQQGLAGTDNSGHCSLWGNWPQN